MAAKATRTSSGRKKLAKPCATATTIRVKVLFLFASHPPMSLVLHPHPQTDANLRFAENDAFHETQPQRIRVRMNLAMPG